MLKLKKTFLDNPIAMEAIRHLSKSTKLEIETAYHIAKLSKKIDSEMNHLREEAIALLKKHAVKDETGSIKNFPQGPFEFIPPNGEDAHDKEFKEMLESEFEVKIWKIKLSELKGAELSPVQIDALEPILDIPV